MTGIQQFNHNKTAPQHVSREANKQKALALRMSRTPDGRVYTYEKIADELGVTRMTVWRWVMEALTEIKYDNQERARELRAVNTQRLELAMGKILEKIEGGTAKAADYNILVKLIQTENKLWGINEPETLELTVKVENMTVEEKIERIEQLMAQSKQLQSGDNGNLKTIPAPEWRVVDQDAEVGDILYGH